MQTGLDMAIHDAVRASRTEAPLSGEVNKQKPAMSANALGRNTQKKQSPALNYMDEKNVTAVCEHEKQRLFPSEQLPLLFTKFVTIVYYHSSFFLLSNFFPAKVVAFARDRYRSCM